MEGMKADGANRVHDAADSKGPVFDDSEQRFRGMFESRFPAIYAYAFRRLSGRHDDTLDVTSEVFATAWRRRETIPMEPNDLLWLYGVARRVVSRHQRGRMRSAHLIHRLEAEAIVRDPDLQGHPHSDGERIRASILELNPRDQEVLSLLLWEQLSQQEAAQVLGCSANAVAQRYRKAKLRLRKQLES
jgi:RNA polymerase sigma factor (sigma-70 family)